MSRKLTNDISMIQSKLGMSRALIIRIGNLSKHENKVIQEQMSTVENNTNILLEMIKDVEKGGRP